MEIFPAIDIKNEQVVRLTQGDYDQVEVYSSEPLEIAKQFVAAGAKNLHVVDLDGALAGKLSNLSVIENLVNKSGLSVQVGGGIRDKERISHYVDAGVARVILGTIAAKQPEFVKEMISLFGKKIAVGVDAKEGKVAIQGWQEITSLDSLSFCKTMEEMGVQTIIYTDIAKDGMMEGTNLEIYKTLQENLSLHIIASGGVVTIEEIKKLQEIGVYGTIIGKALYTGHIKLEEALSI